MTATRPASAKALAADLLNALENVRTRAYAAEVERVMNQAIPLARLINAGLVKQVTDDGRWSLAEAAADLRVLNEEVPDGLPLIDMWDAIRAARETTEN